jgi:uncharacterized protein with ATP-grasp and redox domains
MDVAKFPPPLRGIEKGTFTEYTFKKRLPDIARRTAKEADLSKEAKKNLEVLAKDLPYGIIRPIRDDGAPDLAQWAEWMAPFLGLSWLEAPWFPAETYFFRRILEATGYFRPGSDQGVDPYYPQKRASLQNLDTQLGSLFDQLQKKSTDLEETITRLLHTVIWGNKADLSIWPVRSEPSVSRTSTEDVAHLLVDQSRAAVDYMLEKSKSHVRVDFLLDNVGLELGYDLLLADFLLTNGLASEILFYSKPYPTYVSDATNPDIWDMVKYLNKAKVGGATELGKRLRAHLAGQRLTLHSDSFWISPLMGWEMPEALRAALANSSLIISKGDANYRRWLGDRHWSFTEPVSEILSYRPAPLLLMRVLKSEVVAGLRVGQAEETVRADPSWLYDGSRAVIQVAL